MTGDPLFPGDSEIGQLYSIFRKMGTPNEAVWPGVSALQDYRASFPQWMPTDVEKMLTPRRREGDAALPAAPDATACDLFKVERGLLREGEGRTNTYSGLSHSLQRMMAYEPAARISAKAALSHPYFDDLNKAALA